MFMNSYSWAGVCLFLAVTSPASAQSDPTLNLNPEGTSFFVPVSESAAVLRLATNPTNQLVIDSDGLLDRLEVVIEGLDPSLSTERILHNTMLANVTVSSEVSDGRYEYRFVQGASTVQNFQQLLSSLEYSILALNSSDVSAILSSPSRNISITVVDDTGRNDTAVVLITLQAPNQPPVFPPAQDNYTASITENSPTGTTVFSGISASDPEGTAVTYSIMGGTGTFAIDELSGLVTVNDSSQLDFETTKVFVVTIIATDSDSFNPLTSTATLTVNLIDVNDVAPVFTQPTFSFSVVENNVGASVGTVMATDQDTVGTLVYFFQDTSITDFVIDGATGAIRVAAGQSLDADVSTGGQPQRSFVIIVSDGVHQASTIVNVEVINIEDQRPFIVPIVSTRILNLDDSQTAIILSSDATPLTVSDDGNVERGVATLRLLLNNVESSFPTQYATCRGSTGMEYVMCESGLNPQYNLFTTSALSPESTGSNNPVLISGTDAYQFVGGTGTQSRFLVTGTLHDQVLSLSDHFSMSMWIKFSSSDSVPGLQYVLSFETDPSNSRNRYFSWLFRSNRLNLFYNRDVLVDGTTPSTDLGYGSRVGLSFYWDESIFGDLRNDNWHFVKLDVDFPEMKFYINGHVYFPTEGHYFSVTNQRIGLQRIDTPREMPARILDKTSSTSPVSLSDINIRIGGSVRGNYNFVGEMRLLYITGLMDNSLYTCIASCGESIVPTGYMSGSQNLTADVNGFSTFYNPVSRTLYFDKGSSPPVDYTNFLRSISYSTRDTFPPQEQGEGRRIEFRVSQSLTSQCLILLVVFLSVDC